MWRTLADLMRLDDRAKSMLVTLDRGQIRGAARGGEPPQELEEHLVSLESL